MVAKPPDEGAVVLNRALPSWAIDLLMFGMPTSDRPDAKKVWGAFVSIAMSATVRGWTKAEFINEATRKERRKDKNRTRRFMSHRLWWQLLGYSRSDLHAFQSLERAWDIAGQNLRDGGMRTSADLKASAVETAYGWHDRLLAGTDGLNDTEVLVMGYVVQETERRQMTRVTCPARAVAEHAKISPMAALRKLKNLTARGLLMQHSPGKGGSNPSGRRAAIYSLIDPGEPVG